MHALLIGLLFIIAVTASGQSRLPSDFVPGRDYPSMKLKDGTIYEQVRVLYLSEAEIRIRHENGSASVLLSALTPDELSRTGFTSPPTRMGAMSRLMSPSDRSRTGIDKLSSVEQERLQDWIIRAAGSHLNDAIPSHHRAPITSASQPKRTAPKPHSKPPVRLTASAAPSPSNSQASIPKAIRTWVPGDPLPSRGHYIIEKFRGQNPKIKLEDHSLWEVSPLESYTMFLWQPADDIVLLDGEDPHYPVAMLNTSQGRSVNVRFTSHQ